MKIPAVDTIKTASEAEELAIEWQDWQSTESLSIGELSEWSAFFEVLANKFNLTDVFQENGII